MRIVLILICLAFAVPSIAIEISLDSQPQAKEVEEIPEDSVACVDMMLLFAEHPMTTSAKEKFYKELDKKRQSLKDVNNRFKKLVEKLKNESDEAEKMAVELKNINAGSSEGVEPSVIETKKDLLGKKKKNVKKLNKELLQMQREVVELKKQLKKELQSMESEQTNDVLAHLTKVINIIAKEENVTVVLDKNDIVCGPSINDLTKKVKARLLEQK